MPTTDPNDPTGPAFIPISLVADNSNIITGNSSVGFMVSVPSGQGEPALLVAVHEVQSGPVAGDGILPIEQDLPMQVITFPNMPTPVWEDGYARFTITLDQTIFGILNSPQTVILVSVSINVVGTSSLGVCAIPINLPPQPTN